MKAAERLARYADRLHLAKPGKLGVVLPDGGAGRSCVACGVAAYAILFVTGVNAPVCRLHVERPMRLVTGIDAHGTVFRRVEEAPIAKVAT